MNRRHLRRRQGHLSTAEVVGDRPAPMDPAKCKPKNQGMKVQPVGNRKKLTVCRIVGVLLPPGSTILGGAPSCIAPTCCRSPSVTAHKHTRKRSRQRTAARVAAPVPTSVSRGFQDEPLKPMINACRSCAAPALTDHTSGFSHMTAATGRRDWRCRHLGIML